MSQSASLARVISVVTNPCILSVAVLLLMAYAKSNKPLVLLGWFSVILWFLVVLPLVYVYLRTSGGEGKARYIADPTAFLKQHPRDICVLGVVCGVPCLLGLVFLDAPRPLIYTLVALLATSVVIAVFNLFYRVSYHLGAVTVLVIMAALTWGPALLALLATFPLISWAKYQLHQHTPAQLATGIIVAVVVSGTTLYLLG